jgi:hypothetical protein
MGMARPTGGFVEGMLDGGGWPDVAEDAFYDRARQYLRLLHQVTDVLGTFRRQQGEIFGSGAWSGSAAAAANNAVEANIDELVTLQNDLTTAITWQRKVAGSIEQAKSDIGDNVVAGQREINLLEQNPKLTAEERTTAINSVVSATRVANVSIVQETADQIRESKDWKPPERALQDLLDQKAPPPEAAEPDRLLGDRDPSRGDRSWGQGSPDSSSQPASTTPPPADAPPPMTPVTVATPAAPAAATGGSGAAAPVAPKPLSPAASAGPLGANARIPSMPAAPAAQWAGPRDTSPATAPASAAGMPAAPRGAAAGSGAAVGSSAPVGQGQSGPGMRPASATSHAATPQPTPSSLAASPPSIDRPGDAGTGSPNIPVSAKRAERDAIAAASRRGEADPLVLARRIAAALNAPDGGSAQNMKFFWVTAVTTEGEIVVANNFGVAYIPDGVQLPPPVHMASADSGIPVTERLRWATYPVVAVHQWAAHRNTKLRAVIATQEQFGSSDPGTTKIILQPDDIPQSGATPGRSRLEVVDPEAAKRLAGTDDSSLTVLLPPQPPSPPADRRSRLWLEVMRPLASSAVGREVAHLRAFRAYAVQAQDVILGEARAAADAVSQRSAIADWLYWKHLAELLEAGAAAPSGRAPAKA